MVSSFLHQYRRIVLCTVLGLAALLLFLWASPAGPAYAHLISPPGLAVMTAIVLIFSGLIVALAVMIGPRYLQMAESIMLSFLVLSLVAVLLPNMTMPDWVLGLTLLLLPFAIDGLIYGAQWKRTARDNGPIRLRFFTTASPEIVWRRLCPDPAHSADYYKGGATISALPQGVQGNFLLSYPFRAFKEGVVDTVVHLDGMQRHRHFRARFFSYGGPSGPWNKAPVSEPLGTDEVTIQPVDGGGAWVTLDVTAYRLPLPEHFKMWLTGWTAEETASTKARIEGRADRSLFGRYAEPAAVLQS